MVVAVLHLTLAAVWLGSMVYSLVVVQPRVTRFLPDEQRREELLLLLANGNRWPVVAVLGGLLLSAGALLVLTPHRAAAYGIVLALYLAAGAVFVNVSWRHWPARVFALSNELANYRRRLRRQAWSMLGLVGAAFLIALIVSLGA